MLGGIVLIFWVTGIIAIYYLIHKPWESSLHLEIFTTALDLCLALAMIGLAGGLGRRLVGPLVEVTAPERIVLRAAVGIGVLAIGALLIGMAGLLSSWFAWLALVVGLVVLRRDITDWLSDFKVLVDSSISLTVISRWLLVSICSRR